MLKILLLLFLSFSLISCEYIRKWFSPKQLSNVPEQEKKAELDLNMEFLKKNKNKPGVQTTSSGLQYKVIKEGSGRSPQARDTVEVHYRGTLINGVEFDSSYKRNQTARFGLHQVISGWTEGLQLMKEGGEFEFYIPSHLAYGDRVSPNIPAGSTLIFKVELVKVL